MHRITCTNIQVIEQASSYLDCMSSDDDTEAKFYRSKPTARSLKPASPRPSPLHSNPSERKKDLLLAEVQKEEVERQNGATLRLRER